MEIKACSSVSTLFHTCQSTNRETETATESESEKVREIDTDRHRKPKEIDTEDQRAIHQVVQWSVVIPGIVMDLSILRHTDHFIDGGDFVERGALGVGEIRVRHPNMRDHGVAERQGARIVMLQARIHPKLSYKEVQPVVLKDKYGQN